ncbi:MAG: hypothetical protein AAF927_08325 [Bacteroidota bacterium]
MKYFISLSLCLTLSFSLSAQGPQQEKVFGHEPLPLSSAQLEKKLTEESSLLKLKRLELDRQMQTRLSVEETLRLKAEWEILDQTIRNNERIRARKAVQLGGNNAIKY